MSVADNLNRIIQAKADIKQAIENKGVVVGDGTIDTYAEKIDEITTGGGSGEIKKRIPSSLTISGSTFTEFDMSQWDWSSVWDWSYYFYNCKNLTTIANFPTYTKPYITLNNLFSGCDNLTSVDLRGWDTSKITKMKYTFFGCSGLTSVDLRGWDLSNVTDMTRMFGNCSSLTDVWMDSKLGNLTYEDVSDMFVDIDTIGTFHYNPNYDYSKIINELPVNWTAVPIQ